MRPRPVVRLGQEGAHLDQALGGEIAGLLGGRDHVVPRRQGVQADAFGGKAGDALRKDAVVEDDEAVRDLAAGR